MEKNKAPGHDFAPSWLKINSYDKDLSNLSSADNKKKNNSSCSSSSGLTSAGEDTFNLRPQYLKQVDINSKDSNTSSSSSSSSSHTNQKAGNQISSSQGNTSFDFEVSRNKGWLSSGSPRAPNAVWSSYRQSNLKNKVPSKNSPDALADSSSSASSRRSSSNSRCNDTSLNLSGTSTGREDSNKPNSSYPSHHLHQHHHQNNPNHNNFHQQNNNIKGRNNSTVRNDSPQVVGNTNNGFFDNREEFPSLIDEKQVNVETNFGNNVWDNVANKVFHSGSNKVSLVSRHLGSSLYADKGSMNGAGCFRALVPVVPRRKNVNNINGSSSGSKDNTTLVNCLSNLNLGSTNKIMPVFAKPVNHSSTSHSMAILAKKHSKTGKHSNMRSSSSDSRPDASDTQRPSVHFDEDDDNRSTSSCLTGCNDGISDEKSKDINIVEGNNLDESENHTVHLLSSSLEAEERLLREMGWKEEDEDENFYAPLTEDEVKEFKDLINKRKSSKRYMSPKIYQGRFKFQANSSSQLPLSQLNFLNTLATEDQNNDDTDTSSDDDDDDDEDDDNDNDDNVR